MKNAQATMEYLTIIGAVIVIGLTVVSVATGLIDFGSGTNTKSSKAFWLSQPIAITDAMVGRDGNAIFAIKNNTDEKVTIQGVRVNSTLYTTYYTDNNELFPGEKRAFQYTGLPACTTTTTSFNLSVAYLSKNNLSKVTQDHSFYIDCSSAVALNGSGGSGGTSFSFSPIAGAFLVWDGTDWNASGRSNTGIIIPTDTNKICFNGTTCSANFDWNGSDLIIEVQ